MIIALAQDSKLWVHQAKDILLSLRSNTSKEAVMPHLLLSVTDRLLLYTMFERLTKDSIESYPLCLFIDVLTRVASVVDYTPLNPNGHYKLDLGKQCEWYRISPRG